MYHLYAAAPSSYQLSMVHSRSPRSLRFRIAAVALAALFLATGTREALAGYICQQHAEHSGHAGVLALAAAEAASDHSGHLPSDADSSDDQGPGESESEPCTCLGDCEPGQTVPLTAPHAAAAIHFSSQQASPLPQSQARLPGSPEFLLPYANAPPQLG